MTQKRGILIPDEVILDERLNNNSRMMYGEIAALCYKEGFCWASNAYFAKRYKVSKNTVSRWIQDLIETGYLHSEIQYKNDSKEVENRILTIADPKNKNEGAYHQKRGEGAHKNDDTPIIKNGEDNNTSLFNNTINNTNNTAAPLFTSILKRIDEQLLESLTMEQKQRLQTYVEQIEDPAVIYECVNITEQETPDWPVQYLFKLLDKAIVNKFTLDDVKRDHQQFKQQWEATFRTY